MVPTILTEMTRDDGWRARLVVGGAGGTRITTSVAVIIIKNILLNRDISQSVDDPRLHHQLLPMRIDYQEEFDSVIMQALERMGHNITSSRSAGSVVGAIARLENGDLKAKADNRKSGGVAGLGEVVEDSSSIMILVNNILIVMVLVSVLLISNLNLGH